FQKADNAPLRRSISNVHKLFGDPGKVGIEHIKLAQLIIPVSIETRRDKNEFGAIRFEPGQPARFDELSQSLSTGMGWNSQIDHVFARVQRVHIGKKRMLKKAAH